MKVYLIVSILLILVIYHYQLLRRNHIIILLMVLFFGHSAAWAAACYPNDGQTHNYSADLGNFSITDGSKDQAGSVFNDAWKWDLGGYYYGSCRCPTGQTYHTIYYSTSTKLPIGHIDGTRTFYKINEYFEVASSVWIGGTTQRYLNVPVDNLSAVVGDKGNDKCQDSGIPWSAGSKGTLSFYISKPFIGTTQIPSVEIFRLYINTVSGEAVEPATSQVVVNATISVPQTCVLNSGSIVTVDFGDIFAGKFNKSGQKPDGFTPITKQIAVTCNGGVESMANLTMRFQATPDSNYSSAITTDKQGVGVVVTDMDGNILKPDTGLIPFKLDNSKATVSFQTYPVSTTGTPPSIGKFTALAYIRVDFA